RVPRPPTQLRASRGGYSCDFDGREAAPQNGGEPRIIGAQELRQLATGESQELGAVSEMPGCVAQIGRQELVNWDFGSIHQRLEVVQAARQLADLLSRAAKNGVVQPRRSGR